MMRIIRAGECRKMPWKNGGGTTTEIAVSPAGAGLDDFDWRVSMARVEAGGPFSGFAGVDRTLCVLEGEGMTLDISGQRPIVLGHASAPVSFPADQPTAATLSAGPIADLNVMTRRGRMSHDVRRLELDEPTEIAVEEKCGLFFCHRGRIRLDGSPDGELGPLDTALATDVAGVIHLEPVAMPAVVFVVRIHDMRAHS